MRIQLENIGKIHQTQIDLNGITAIAGENNTGKSTVGKALFCIFNSFYHLNQKIRLARRELIAKAVYDSFNKFNSDTGYSIYSTNVADAILQNKNQYLIEGQEPALTNLLRHNLHDSWTVTRANAPVITLELVQNMSGRIKQVLDIPEEQTFIRVLENTLKQEFSSKVMNFHHSHDIGKIALQIKNKTLQMYIKNNKITQAKNLLELQTQAIYLDDPFVLDELDLKSQGLFGEQMQYSDSVTHRGHLKNLLKAETASQNVETAMKQIVADTKLKKILTKINSVCDFDMKKADDALADSFVFLEGTHQLSAENISTGLKTFIILKRLLYTGYLEENGLLILDEPEVHLHPQWQILFAEIIVLLQKEFGMHILLTTHSPYFLRAIEVYSAKYQIADKCKYYLADIKNGDAFFEDVTTQTNKIYKKLVLPFENLQRTIYSEK
ncbi:AAA family ATPase [Megasphaera elsdenii]|uniref:AAA family ATPase n=1 Tax=Megasphaera elsdenii TaxID=907 RepID=UPI00242B22C3|nr:AAA family ATPase [Megasphaera elsdenii]